jgi:hypothetical protein
LRCSGNAGIAGLPQKDGTPKKTWDHPSMTRAVNTDYFRSLAGRPCPTARLSSATSLCPWVMPEILFAHHSRNAIMPEQKDTIVAVLGASAALAGLLLVFIGFVYARGESYETRRGNRFKIVAKIGVVPFLVTLACAWFCLEWLTGTQGAYSWSIGFFKLGLVTTAIYGAITLLFYL